MGNLQKWTWTYHEITILILKVEQCVVQERYNQDVSLLVIKVKFKDLFGKTGQFDKTCQC